MNNLMRPILHLFLLPFYCVITFRNFLFNKGVLKSNKLNGIVISVGGISFGGQGKTPLTLYIAKLLRNRDLKVCILSRGYKRKSKGIVVVSDGKGNIMPPKTAGDEPYLLASNLRDVPVIVSENRYEGGKKAEELFNPDVFVLDDGFQHRKLKRDMDIITLAPSRNNLSSIQREAFFHIRRSDMVVISKADRLQSRENLEKKVSRYTDSPVFTFKMLPEKIARNGEEIELTDLKDTNVFVFCGIGDPYYFIESLQNKGLAIKGNLILKDHYGYTENDVIRIVKKFKQSNSDLMITTEKDWNKVHNYIPEDYKLYYVIPKNIITPQEDFDKMILSIVMHSGKKNN